MNKKRKQELRKAATEAVEKFHAFISEDLSQYEQRYLILELEKFFLDGMIQVLENATEE
jgi:hypothetical protein